MRYYACMQPLNEREEWVGCPPQFYSYNAIRGASRLAYTHKVRLTLSFHLATVFCTFPANTRHRPNVGPMSVHRLRLWSSSGPALG